MTERIRNLVVLLNSRDKGIVNGAEVVKELEKAFNCYGSYAAMAVMRLWQKSFLRN